MKGLTTFLSIAVLFVSACGTDVDTVQVAASSEGVIVWQDAERLINAGEVVFVSKADVPEVTIGINDGTLYRTIQPKIDEVLTVIEKSGKKNEILVIAK